MKGDPLRSQNHDVLKSSTVGPTNNFFFKVFFRLRIFFFRKKKIFFKEQLLFSFLCIVKQKKNFGAIRKFLKIYIIKKGLKGGISIDTDSGPPRNVLLCCAGICHQPYTFIQIGSGHTVFYSLTLNVYLFWHPLPLAISVEVRLEMTSTSPGFSDLVMAQQRVWPRSAMHNM